MNKHSLAFDFQFFIHSYFIGECSTKALAGAIKIKNKSVNIIEIQWILNSMSELLNITSTWNEFCEWFPLCLCNIKAWKRDQKKWIKMQKKKKKLKQNHQFGMS